MVIDPNASEEIVNWDLGWQQQEVNRAAGADCWRSLLPRYMAGDTMQLCSRIAPILVVGQRVELIRLI